MRVFGIDCGTEITGFGVVETPDGSHPLVCMAMGAIRLGKIKSTPERLEQVFHDLTAELERWKPDAVAIEEVFYSVNAKSALKLGQVRGVALLAAACQKLPVAEYAPLKIKSSVVGYGLAKKEQVQFMVARLLDLAELPQPADAADALAIAICHIHTAQTELGQMEQGHDESLVAGRVAGGGTIAAAAQTADGVVTVEVQEPRFANTALEPARDSSRRQRAAFAARRTQRVQNRQNGWKPGAGPRDSA